MIDTVKNFIEDFIKLEQEVLTLNLDGNKRELFNDKLLEMETFAIPEMRNTFGVILKDENYFEFEDISFENKTNKVSEEILAFINSIDTTVKFRYLFKIEEYINNLYKVFLSVANPQSKNYGQCFIVQMIENENRIVAKYFLDNQDPLNIIWRFNSGNRSIAFDQKKKPINVKRFLDPSDDTKSMEIHNEKIS